MVTTVRLTVQTGPHKDKKFCFCGATRCLIGRAPDCFVNMSGTERDRLISRHHCELAIDPPSIRIQDLGSQNGTYINGKPVEPICERLDQMVQSGDLLTIGGTTFQVDIVECPPKGLEGGLPALWNEGEIAKKNCPIDCSGKGPPKISVESAER